MKYKYLMGTVVVLLCVVHLNALDIDGYFKSYGRISYGSDSKYMRIENDFGIKIETQLYDNVSFFSNMDTRLLSIPRITSIKDMYEYPNYFKNSFRLKEIYVNILKFPFEFMDIRAGKQRIVWGAGDELSPNDFVNPYDFQDRWSFKNRIGVYSVKTDLYYNNLTVTGVLIPYFTPDLLPDSSNLGMFNQSTFFAPGITIGKISDTIISPGVMVKDNVIGGGRVSYNIFDYDFSLYYLYSRTYLPWVKEIIVMPDTVPSIINVKSELFYPRIHMSGFSFSGAVGNVGIWGDISLFIPRENHFLIDLSALGMGEMDTTNIEGKFYLKYLLGFDYTFSNEFYISIQYLHGFVNEKSNDNLHDYIFVGSRYPIFDNKIELSPFDCGIEVDDFSNIRKSYGIIFIPSLKIKPYDNLSISVSSLLSWGTDKTVLRGMKSYRGIQLGIEYLF